MPCPNVTIRGRKIMILVPSNFQLNYFSFQQPSPIFARIHTHKDLQCFFSACHRIQCVKPSKQAGKSSSWMSHINSAGGTQQSWQPSSRLNLSVFHVAPLPSPETINSQKFTMLLLRVPWHTISKSKHSGRQIMILVSFQSTELVGISRTTFIFA